MDTLDTGYLGYLCIADTAVLQIQAKIKYCICIHGYVRIHVPPGTGRRSGAAVDGRHVRCTVSEELCAAADAMRMGARGGPMQEGIRAGCGGRRCGASDGVPADALPLRCARRTRDEAVKHTKSTL